MSYKPIFQKTLDLGYRDLGPSKTRLERPIVLEQRHSLRLELFPLLLEVAQSLCS